ncbi:DUF3889 domain-containing protein [Bacillus sp. DJP31]|uniref:DUF3889 domain-containing protein n=1 Tax=Bacillus sp. DJP31 TaxID=3409789 RepID=UPI003BB6F220
MKKKLAFPLICLAFIIGIFASYSFNETVGVAEQPDYEKWGKIAINVVKESYVNEQVSDYKYEGRKSVSDVKAEDTFSFQVKRDNKEFTVKAVVAFNPKTETLQSLALVEVTP